MITFRSTIAAGSAAPSRRSRQSYLDAEWGQDESFVLLNGDGHWWIAFDYRTRDSAEPCVTWVDNEVGQDIRLAETFREFLLGVSAPPPRDE